MSSTRELAQLYGTSLTTVHTAIGLLARDGLVATRPGSGTYVRAEPRIRHSDPPQVWGVLVPSMDLYGKALDGIQATAEEVGATVTVACSQYDEARELTQVRRMIRNGVQVLIMAPTSCHRDDHPLWQELLAEVTVPAVFIERTPPPSASSLVSTVTSNLLRGTIDAVTHTVNAGRHRIGFVGPEMEAHETGVYEGYLEGLHRAGLPLLPDAAITTADFDHAQFGSWAIDLDLDAVFTLRQPSAIQLAEQLRAAGRRIPDDVMFTGFWDRTIGAARLPFCGLTLPRYRIGVMAASLVLHLTERNAEPASCIAQFTPALGCQCPTLTS